MTFSDELYTALSQHAEVVCSDWQVRDPIPAETLFRRTVDNVLSDRSLKDATTRELLDKMKKKRAFERAFWDCIEP